MMLRFRGRKYGTIYLFFVVFVIALCPFSLWTYVLQITRELFRRASLTSAVSSSTAYVLFQKLFYENHDRNVFSLEEFSSAQNSLTPEYNYLKELVRLHSYQSGKSFVFYKRRLSELPSEAMTSFTMAVKQKAVGRYSACLKLLKHAVALDPQNPIILTALGEAIEQIWDSHSKGNSSKTSQMSLLVSSSSASGIHHFRLTEYAKDLITAEQLYAKALIYDPKYKKAKANQRETLPVVEQIDQQRLHNIDLKVARFYLAPDSNPGLKLVKIEHYFQHIYHSNSIEGNTLSLAQTRAILETRIAIGGKSLQEQNEVLGLDAAFRYLNTTLLRGSSTTIEVADLLELHRRVLSFVDFTEAGRFRQTQVFIADHVPPSADLMPHLVAELMDWIDSAEAADLHPIELAALAHWKLVYIHPFYDGNGRTARLLMNLLLMRAGFPPAIIHKEERHLYYETLKIANVGDVRPFIRFIADCTEKTIDEYLLAAFGTSVGGTRLQDEHYDVSLTRDLRSDDSKPLIASSGPMIQYAPTMNFLLDSLDGSKSSEDLDCRNRVFSLESHIPEVIYST